MRRPMTQPIELPAAIKSLGEAIRYLREQRGITLRGLARKIDVSAPFLSDVEHSRRQTDKLPEIARALGVEVAVLEALDPRLPEELKEWISATPGIMALLKDMKASGSSAEQLRTRFSRRR